MAHGLRFFRSALLLQGAEDTHRRQSRGVGTEEEPSGVPSGFRMPSIGSSKLFFVEKELAFKSPISLMAKGECESGREPLRSPPGPWRKSSFTPRVCGDVCAKASRCCSQIQAILVATRSP